MDKGTDSKLDVVKASSICDNSDFLDNSITTGRGIVVCYILLNLAIYMYFGQEELLLLR
jgi:hypothetical protein